MSMTGTRTVTQTTTHTKIVYVTRKVQADLLEIMDTYGFFSQDYTRNVINDVRVLLDEEVIDKVRFIWTPRGSSYVIDAFEYTVIAAGIGLADDRAGGIGYQPALANADFTVRIFYNQRWQSMGESDKQAIQGALSLRWGPGGQLDYSGGRWIADRTYSMEGYGLPRSRFER